MVVEPILAPAALQHHPVVICLLAHTVRCLLMIPQSSFSFGDPGRDDPVGAELQTVMVDSLLDKIVNEDLK